MALAVCDDCTTAYAAGLSRCPHCGSTESHEEGTPMAKITVHGGPSDKHNPEPTTPVLPEREHAGTGQPMEGIKVPVGTAHELTGDGPGHALPPAEEHEGQLMEHDPATGETHPVEPEAPARPVANASKGDWLAYAQALHPDEDLTGYTKADLIELYGG